MKVKNLFKGWLCALSCWLTVAYADVAPSQQLATLLNGLQMTQGQFSQTLYSHRGQVLQKSTGTFALSRPGQFRWQTLAPTPQLLIADGKKVWLYDPDLNQVSWFAEQLNNKQSPAMLLVGNIEDLARQYVIRFKQNDQQQSFTLTPKKSSFFEQVQLVFDEGSLSSMTIQDNLHQVTHIEFDDLSEGAPASLFQFTPPKGADVVEAAV